MNHVARDQRVAAAIAALVGSIATYAIRQVDPDLYGHLVYGQLFIQHGGPVDSDPFGYTSAGTRWVAFEYLSQVSIAFAYDALGPAGLVLWKCVIGGMALWCVWKALRTVSDEPIICVTVFVLCAVPVSRYFVFRSQVVTFACFAFFVAVLFRYVLFRRAALWALPLLMILWANSHGGFVAGLGAIGLAGVLLAIRDRALRNEERPSAGLRPLVLAFAASVLATFATPFGFALWQYVLTELTHDTNRRYVTEWQPVNWAVDPWSIVALVTIAIALAAATWTGGWRRMVHHVPAWVWAATCVPLLVMSVASVRHVPLAMIWSAPVLAVLASQAWTSAARPVFAPAWLLVTALATVPAIAAAQHVVQRPTFSIATGGELLGRSDPCRLTSAMAEHRVGGNVFVPLWWGAYLTWRLYPAIRVSADGRNISAFPRDVVLENMRFFTDSGQDVEIPLKYDTDLLVVPVHAPVLDAVRSSTRWAEVYADTEAVLFRSAGRPPVTREHVVAVRADDCGGVLQ